MRSGARWCQSATGDASSLAGGLPASSEKAIHVIATHKHPKVLRWLSRHPRFVFHFTPTSCSWLNAVETFFSRLTRRRPKRGLFRSIVDLQAAIKRFIADHNAEPKPFVWTADPDNILDKVTRGTQALASMH
jgi:transposase